MKDPNESPRPPTPFEQTLISALINAVGADSQVLRQQFAVASVAGESADDGFDIVIIPDRAASLAYPGASRNPVTATARDDEGGPVMVQLLLNDGYLQECSVFRLDGGALVGLPNPSLMLLHDTSGELGPEGQHFDMPEFS